MLPMAASHTSDDRVFDKEVPAATLNTTAK